MISKRIGETMSGAVHDGEVGVVVTVDNDEVLLNPRRLGHAASAGSIVSGCVLAYSLANETKPRGTTASLS